MFQIEGFADFWCWGVFPLFFAVTWLLFIAALLTGRRPLQLQPRNEVPWGLIDVVLLFGSMMVAKVIAQLISISIIASQESIPIQDVTMPLAYEYGTILMGSSVICQLVQLLLAIVWIRLWHRASWSTIGICRERIWKDICAGLVASLMIIPPLLLMNLLLHRWLEIEYSHQVLTLVRHAAVWTGISTVIVAPLVEEMHFRVFIQGWLQRIINLTPGKKVSLLQGDRLAEKIRGSAAGEGRGASDLERGESQSSHVPRWPIFVSALIFASMHLGQGAGPYTLFVLALVLGFLYRQFNSVIPCIVVHLVLNLWSFLALIYSLPPS